MNRRQVLELLGLGTVSAFGAVLSTPTSASAKSLPLPSAVFPSLEQQTLPILALATSLPQEYSYEAQVEGQIPAQLQGTLYRNGFGLFERGRWRKRLLLDGDGMIQAFRVQDGKVYYRNRFVRTRKYLQEAAVGTYLYDTWTTQAPGNNRLRESGGQAAITVFVRNGRLYAFDEQGSSWVLNPENLRTIEASRLGLPQEFPTDFKAHSKIDGRTGEWILFTLTKDNSTYYIATLNSSGTLIQQKVVQMPRVTYMHDFFVSEQHVIFNLHPMELDVQKLRQSESSFLDTMRWRPEQGNILVVVNRAGAAEPIQLPTETAWMWHVLNAYEADGEIIADFVGYDNPDHFVGSDPVLASIMSGRLSEQRFPGTLRRYAINLNRKTVRQEILDTGNHDYPFVNQQLSCHRHRFGYFTNGLLPSAIKRVDMQTGKSQVYDFGEGCYCFEPVFAPLPGFDYGADLSAEPGWLLTEVLDGFTKKGFLAIFAAERVSDGPIARAHLLHHVPYNAHGYWQSLS